ncbi:MAG: riboflavin synthase [Chitinophagaceae bacterium]
MFTGIIETLGLIKDVISNGSNRTFWIESSLSHEFKTDQSVSHSGVCLTIEEIKDSKHRVTAIDETLQKTNLGDWVSGTYVNIERCLPLNGRLDGHFVQGHVDTTGVLRNQVEKDGSWEFEIEYPGQFAALIVEKGSISVNGISLTAFNITKTSFWVAVIPYTFEHTNIKQTAVGNKVNLEFDLLGKYIQRSIRLKL